MNEWITETGCQVMGFTHNSDPYGPFKCQYTCNAEDSCSAYFAWYGECSLPARLPPPKHKLTALQRMSGLTTSTSTVSCSMPCKKTPPSTTTPVGY
jgi:hypothetical protein